MALLVDAENDSRYIHDFAYPGLRHSFREYAAMACRTARARVSAAARKDVATPAVISTLREFCRRRGPGHGRRGPHRALGARAESVPTRTIPAEVPAAGLKTPHIY